MVDDKYIGLALAVASSAAIGSSYIITKKGLNDAAERDGGYVAASDDYAYLRNPTWWLGMGALVLGEAANFAAYTFAPAILVTPLGALTVLVGAVLASIFLKEELGHLGRIGSLLCLLGATIIVLHAPEDKEIETVDEILHYAIQPGFLMFCFTALVFCLIMIYHVVPRHGKKNPMVYISICSISGAVSVMAVKGFGVAVKLTFGGKNQFTHPSTYVFAIVMIVCIVVQLNYFNKALDTFSTNVVNPMYYVGFSSSVIVASLILFQGFNTDNTSNSISLILGFIVTFLGVHLLNLSRHPEPPASVLPSSVPFEGGLLSPRITGRTSADGWPSSPTSGVSHHHRHSRSLEGLVGHRRGGSRYQVQDSAVFALSEEDEGEGVPLKRLNDDSDDDELEADERTRLRRHMNGDANGGTSSPSKNARL